MKHRTHAMLFFIMIMFSHSVVAQTQKITDNNFHYQLPANINDFKGEPEKLKSMKQLWNWNMNAFNMMAIVGNPWTNQFDYPRVNYFNPLTTSIRDEDLTVIDPVTWTAFPNRVDWYFSTSQYNPYQIPKELIYPLVDNGRLNKNDPALKKWMKYQDEMNGTTLNKTLDELLKKFPALASKDLSNFAPLPIPTDICPVVNWDQDPSEWKTGDGKNSFGPGGPRGWKDEYNEWVVARNADGKITKISFTAENPEYWFSLWHVDPSRVLALYHQLVSEKVKIDDLYLTNKKGKPVLDYRGKHVYNPLNKWNYGNTATANGGGAAHLTSPPNTVGAEMYLGAAATIIRNLSDADYSPQNNNCASQYGSSFRNSDPNIGFQVNEIVKNAGLSVTLTNPIALYMQTPDFSNYKTPDGTDPATFFKVVRGKTAQQDGRNYDQILHATYEVPENKGYTVSDITIDGQQIWWGAQMAETFNQALAGTAYTNLPNVDGIGYPAVSDNPQANPWAQPLVKYEVLKAVNDQPKISNATIPLLPPVAHPGMQLKDMALEAIDGKKDVTIVYTRSDGSVEKGINVTLKDAHPMGNGQVTGKHGVFETIIYVIDIDIDEDVKSGQYGVRVTNQGSPEQVAVPGNLTITDVSQ